MKRVVYLKKATFECEVETGKVWVFRSIYCGRADKLFECAHTHTQTKCSFAFI